MTRVHTVAQDIINSQPWNAARNKQLSVLVHSMRANNTQCHWMQELQLSKYFVFKLNADRDSQPIIRWLRYDRHQVCVQSYVSHDSFPLSGTTFQQHAISMDAPHRQQQV